MWSKLCRRIYFNTKNRAIIGFRRHNLFKRAFDIIFAVLFLLVFSPIYIVTAIIIKITSPGPIIYKAKRVGKDGKLFICYKFRSMCVESGEVHITTLKDDKRVYAFGKFIRATKIDELPQMVNILLGQMSVVGPRPEDETNADSIYVGEYKKLLSARPGLTSPGSIYDFTHGELIESEEKYISDFLPEKLELELYYVEKSTFFYDIRIVLRTAAAIFCKVFGITCAAPAEYEKIVERISAKKMLVQTAGKK